MLNSGILRKRESEFLLTDKGEQFFKDFGLNLADLRKKGDYSLVHALIGVKDTIILQVL